MSRTVLTISQAEVRFGPVPAGGAAVDPATLTDYSCQITEARIEASANTVDVPATFCEPASQRAVASSFSLVLNGLQDWGQVDSFSEWMLLNDGLTAAFALYLNGAVDPRATGIISVSAGDFGGVAGEVLTWSQTFPILGYPVITKADGSPVRPGGTVATGATAGSPGTWTPTGATAPANLAAMAGVTATPATAWTTGQHMILGDASHAHWDSDSWESGDAT